MHGTRAPSLGERLEIYENCVARGEEPEPEPEPERTHPFPPPPLITFLHALEYTPSIHENENPAENFVYADPVNYTPCPFI